MQTFNGLFADINENDWNSWHWQLANRAKSIQDLESCGIALTDEEKQGLEVTLGRMRMAVTPYYLSLIDLKDPYDPIRKQAIPTEAELHFAKTDSIFR